MSYETLQQQIPQILPLGDTNVLWNWFIDFNMGKF
jgi:hypothetical protein